MNYRCSPNGATHTRGVGEQDALFLEALLRRNLRSVEPGARLLELGAPHHEIHVIIEGWAMRRKVMPNGTYQIVALHLPGDICEFNALLGSASDTEVMAINTVRAATISARMLNEMAQRPRLSRALWMEAMASGSIQRQWFANIAYHNASRRVAHLICEFAHRLDQVGQTKHLPDVDSLVFACPLTQYHLGNATAMSVEHTNRTLAQLKKSFGLHTRGGVMKIGQLGKMQEFCHFSPGYITLEIQTHPIVPHS
ncbi:MAG: Crp/Fnr family transcriptional regulator [Novosphingobium sp.]